MKTLNNLRAYEEFLFRKKKKIEEKPVNYDNKKEYRDDGYYINGNKVFCPHCGSANVEGDRYDLIKCNDCDSLF